MDPAILQKYWDAARQLLLQFRAGAFPTVDALHQELLNEARQIDTNRRTSPYNLKSLYEDAFNLITGQTLKLAQKWLDDGKPQVPAI